jgi:hypothetical protein
MKKVLPDIPPEREAQGKIALAECANMINRQLKLCLDWETCVYWNIYKRKKECRYFRESVCREGRPPAERP